ncbi:MAG: LysR family transcriptional regulator [Pseudomonadales bacterium]
MDMELLRTFLELNRTRHFRRAAESLHITQAGVSSRLKSLEAQLGVTLFERSRRAMRLTPEGVRLVRRAERLLASWALAVQDVATPGPQLAIGGSLRLWDVMLQSWVHDLRLADPELAIVAEAQTPDYLTRALIDGSLDVAIMLEPAQLEILQTRVVSNLRFLCVSDRAGLDVSVALRSGFVYVDWGLAHDLDHRRAFPDAPESLTRVSHPRMALAYLSQVGGSAYLPRRMIEQELASGVLHPVVDAPVFVRPAYAVWPLRSPRLALIERSLAMISDL